MRARLTIGGTVIAILFVGMIYAFISLIIYNPELSKQGNVITEYTLAGTQVPGVDYINLNITIKAGGLAVSFTGNSNMVYRLRFKQGENEAEPLVKHARVDNKLLVNVLAENSQLEAMFGNRYTYNGTLKVEVGVLSTALSEHSNVDSFNFIVAYAGGLSLEILEDASFNHLSLKANMGGVRLRVNAPSLRRSGSISARVEVGGFFIERISVGNLGVRLAAFTDIGRIALNPAGFEVIKEAETTCEIRTSNYLTAPARLDINISVGLGGAVINHLIPGMPTFDT